MRVFLDANILFSASSPTSRTFFLLSVLREHGELVTSPYAVEEAAKNLGRKMPPEALYHFDAVIRLCEVSSDTASVLDVQLPLKDRPILAGAVGSKATHLLTGDKTDFGHLFGETIRGVKVVSPQMMADEIVALGWI